MTEDSDSEVARATGGPDTDDDPGWPISFILLVAAGGLYLILRVIQIVADVVG